MDTPTPYQNFSTRDDDSESGATTDIESVLLEEKQWHDLPLESRGRPLRPETRMAKWRRNRWLIDTGLILFNVALSLVLLVQVLKTGIPQATEWQVGGDFTRTDPACKSLRPSSGSWHPFSAGC